MSKFLYYEGRHGGHRLTPHTIEAWEWLKVEMQDDNNASFEDIRRDFGDYAFSGSFEYNENAHLSIDDGGSIETIKLTEIQ